MALSNAVIAALQIMYTGRGVSQSDLNWWATQGANIGYTDAVLLFANSADASQKYPFLQAPQSASKEQYVIQVFQNLYNIAAADIPAAELTYWVNWLGEAPNNPTNTPNYLLFPDALNSASAAAGLTSRITALTNKSDISIENANAQGAAGNVSFTQALYSEAAAIIAPVNETDASVATAQQQIIASTGGGGTPFTFLGANPVLTSTASINVSPANTFLTSNSNTVNALTFLNGAIVIDPSTSDSDVLNALIAGAVTPTTIENVETVRLTATGAGAAINVASITKLKSLEVVKGDLQIKSAESHPINLNAGYASILSLNSTDTTQVVTVNLKGTASGASIVDLNNTKSININVQAESVLKNSGTVIGDAGVSPFNITGSKNLAIDGDVLLAAGSKIDASAFTGKLDIAFGKNSTNIVVVGGQADDSFTFTSQDNLINGSTVNGSQGVNILSAKVGAVTTALDKVTNVSTVTLMQAGADTTITAVQSLVAAGQTLKVDASSFTTKFLVFDGSAETNGSFNLISGAGSDNLIGGDLADTLTSGAGNDFLFGNAGNDTLLGGAGGDFLFGDAGDDILNGGPGLDNLTGGAGKDKFVLDQATAGNVANITDFTLADDVFALSNAAFTGAPAVGATIVTSTAGAAANLATTVIVDSTAAIGVANLSNVRFAYDTTTNALLFDADGNFGAGSVIIATTNAITPAGGNFSIIA